MTIPSDIIKKEPSINEWCILHGYRGSISHGTYSPSSNPDSIDDKDTMGICIPPLAYYFGMDKGTWAMSGRGTREIKEGEWDIVVYESGKYIDLASSGNPNVLSLLWLEPSNYIKIEPAGKLLLDNRHLFVGRHVYKSFSGYALSQLKRMTHFDIESQREYSEVETELEKRGINVDKIAGMQSEIANKKTAHEMSDIELMAKMSYLKHHFSGGYMGKKRKELVQKFHFDCKNAAHMIRLLRMCMEFLKDGELYVKRHDAQQLLEIKHGEWTLQQVKDEADRLFKLCDTAYLNSNLPKSPDKVKINELSIDIVKYTLKQRGEI